MEFHALGEQCSVADCRQLDFLPFTCDGCGRKHCAAHRSYAEHHCATPKTEPVRAAPCPVCSQVIAAGKDESLDARMDTHLRLGCAAEAAQRRQRKEKNMCSHPKCHKTELLPFHCRDCGQSYCLRHRLGLDHACAQVVAARRHNRFGQAVTVHA